MPTWVILDVFQLTLTIPKSLPDARVDNLRRLLTSRKFRTNVQRVMTILLTACPGTPPIRAKITV